MAFPGAGWSKEVHDLAAVDELQLGERHDSIPVQRGLEREVKAGQRLDRGQPRHHQGDLDPSVLAQGQFLSEQRIDGLNCGQFTAFDAAHRHVEDLDRTRHLEADKGLLDAVD
jgi:hypothetical protein